MKSWGLSMMILQKPYWMLSLQCLSPLNIIGNENVASTGFELIKKKISSKIMLAIFLIIINT